MKRNRYIVLLLSFLFVACAQEKTESFLSVFKQTDTVVAVEVLPEIKQNLFAPTTLYAQGKHLLFAESKLDTLLMLYDMETKTVCRVLNRGQGPLEAISVSSLGYGGTPEIFYAHDSRGQNVFRVYLTDSLGGISLSKDTIRLSYLCASVAFDGDMSFFMQNAASKRFLLVSSDNHLNFGEPIEIEGVDTKAMSKALQGPCVLSPEQKRIVWFSSINDVFEIYDYSKGYEVNLITSQACYVPMVRNDGAITPKEHIGVRSLTADNNYIYALYIGKSFKELMQQGGDASASICSKMILVFDWDGNPVRIIETDREMYAITYTAVGHCLYGLGLDDEDNYAVYQIAVGY